MYSMCLLCTIYFVIVFTLKMYYVVNNIYVYLNYVGEGYILYNLYLYLSISILGGALEPYSCYSKSLACYRSIFK